MYIYWHQLFLSLGSEESKGVRTMSKYEGEGSGVAMVSSHHCDFRPPRNLARP